MKGVTAMRRALFFAIPSTASQYFRTIFFIDLGIDDSSDFPFDASVLWNERNIDSKVMPKVRRQLQCTSLLNLPPELKIPYTSFNERYLLQTIPLSK
jgi:hypothetical protein